MGAVAALVAGLAAALIAALCGLAVLVAQRRATSRDLARIAAALDAHDERPTERLRVESGDAEVAAVAAAVNRAFDAEAARAAAREADWGRFNEGLAALSHDLRTPLAGTQGYLQLIDRTSDLNQKNHYFAAASERLAAMRALTEDLYDYARVSTPALELKLEPVDLEQAVITAFAARYLEFEQRGWQPALELAGDGARVLADPDALARIVENLAQNALVHASGAPRVIVAGSRLTVENPIDAATAAVLDPARVFDDFYRADASRHGGGSGLGLATVRRLANAMGAEATASLDGTVFAVTVAWDEMA